MKDIRDTYASQLLTCGVRLGYVSRQPGHSKPTVTADHYAKWCGEPPLSRRAPSPRT